MTELTDKEVCHRLCVRDPRYPLFEELYPDDEEIPVPRTNCYCDNCFYGRDALALEILRLRSEIARAANVRK